MANLVRLAVKLVVQEQLVWKKLMVNIIVKHALAQIFIVVAAVCVVVEILVSMVFLHVAYKVVFV